MTPCSITAYRSNDADTQSPCDDMAPGANRMWWIGGIALVLASSAS